MHPRITLLALACGATLLGCTKDPVTTSPEHATDKATVLAELEDPDRDSWAKPNEVLAALPITRDDMVVADIGSGSGYFTRRLAQALPAGMVYAVDVDRDYKHYIEARKEAWETPNIETRLAMYENPLLPERSVDLVFISNTYAFITDRTSYLEAVNAALTPGGKLVVIDFRADASCEGIERCTPADQRLPKATVMQEASASGLTLEREESFLPHQYFLIFGK